MSMNRLLLTAALALALCGTAYAGEKTYLVKTFDEPAGRGLPVAKPLADFVATSRVRVLVPSTWKPKGTTQFDTPSNGSCSYRVKFTVHSRIDDPGDAAARVAAAVPGSGAFVLDSGQRNGGAWRVVRKSVPAAVHVDAQWSGVLTRRKDIAPAGKVRAATVYTHRHVIHASLAGGHRYTASYRPADRRALVASLLSHHVRFHVVKASAKSHGLRLRYIALIVLAAIAALGALAYVVVRRRRRGGGGPPAVPVAG